MKTTKTPAVPTTGIVIHIWPSAVPNAYLGVALKDGKELKRVTEPTLYHAVAGQLREFLDLGPYK